MRECPKCNRHFTVLRVVSDVPRSNADGKVFCPYCEHFCGTIRVDPSRRFVVTNSLSLQDIKQEFDETLGYIRGDITWLITHSCLNYTIALLIGCGCEMLAACEGDTRKRHGEKVFAELLPAGELQVLADRIYAALRDGLAHGFDTKHLLEDDEEHQIYLSVQGPRDIKIIKPPERGVGLHIGTRPLAEALCAKITEFENLLQHDEAAQQRFLKARQPTAALNTSEAAAWRTLVAAAGL